MKYSMFSNLKYEFWWGWEIWVLYITNGMGELALGLTF